MALLASKRTNSGTLPSPGHRLTSLGPSWTLFSSAYSLFNPTTSAVVVRVGFKIHGSIGRQRQPPPWVFPKGLLLKPLGLSLGLARNWTVGLDLARASDRRYR